MKGIFMIMEQTCGEYRKMLCGCYFVLFFIQCLLGYMFYTPFSQQNAIIYYLPILVAFFFVNRIHAKRLNVLRSNGAFHRIRLLPMTPSSFAWSELLFTGISYAMIVFVQQMVMLVIFMMNRIDYQTTNHAFLIYALSNEASIFFTPHSLTQLVAFLLWFVALIVVFTQMHLAMAYDQWIGRSILYLVAYVGVCFLLNTLSLLLTSVLIFIIMVISFLNLRSITGVGRWRS